MMFYLDNLIDFSKYYMLCFMIGYERGIFETSWDVARFTNL